MNAQSMEDAKARAMKVVQGFYNEITAKEKAKAEERLMQENWILKRTVVIQHQLRQKEKQDSKELLKALQLKNYASTLHLNRSKPFLYYQEDLFVLLISSNLLVLQPALHICF